MDLRTFSYCIFQTIRHTFSPKFGKKIQSECSLPGLLGWGQQWSGVTGNRSRVAAAGSWRWQEWGDAAGPGCGGGGVLAVQSKGARTGVPAVVYYSTREEGTGGAGTLGEESL